DFCCFSARVEEHEDDLCCVSDHASAQSFPSCVLSAVCRWLGWLTGATKVCNAKSTMLWWFLLFCTYVRNFFCNFTRTCLRSIYLYFIKR
uniref:Uncharacterized protein n=1 Tax=Aegilops tauschii subsp. strangulata TaxID=200361 RepID=A0A453BMX7_AEGTS